MPDQTSEEAPHVAARAGGSQGSKTALAWAMAEAVAAEKRLDASPMSDQSAPHGSNPDDTWSQS